MTPPALPPLPDTLTDNLARRYAEPHRHYHSLSHVKALQTVFDAHRDLARQPAHIEAAIWYHDAIYDTRRRDNEVASADLVRFELMSIGWLGIDVERVATMVEATRGHHAAEGDTDTWLFLDLDLSVLASPVSQYEAYVRAIRAEFDWVPEPDWRTGRLQVLRSFVDRPTLYRTPSLALAWEAPARANLAREIAALSA